MIKVSSRHTVPVRGLDNVPESSISGGRFGRLFRNLGPAPFKEGYLRALGMTMIADEFAARKKKGEDADVPLDTPEPDDENPTIPAGYTYLGQFIDHDITFDPVSSLDRENDPDALHDFRTPRLDLDSVYGSGPAQQPFLYEGDGPRLQIGVNKAVAGSATCRPDHLRAWTTPAPMPPSAFAKSVRAIIGDPRNDENNIVQQIHVLFMLFHNRVCDEIAADTPKDAVFSRAQNLVRWHYQWIVLHDFIPRICGQETYERVVLGKDGMPNLRFFRPKSGEGYIPVEFSVAAYRFGHSMVRPSYSLNPVARTATPAAQNGFTFHRIPIFSVLPEEVPDDLANLNGFRVLPDQWGIDWSFFFDLPHDHVPGPVVLPQPSYRIDTILSDPLAKLPDHVRAMMPVVSLPELNLLRGWRLGLPSGQAVARIMGVEEADVIPDAVLFEHEDETIDGRRKALLNGDPNEIRRLFGSAVDGLDFRGGSPFADNCPLWYYILREAELKGDSEHLGPVGGTIVAEVLAGLIAYDRKSFLRVFPKWKPTLGPTPGTFTMPDLVHFVDGGSAGTPSSAAAAIGDPTIGGTSSAASARGV